MLVSAIITAHREGLLAGPAIRSFRLAIIQARASGIDVEELFVLDRADDLTRDVFETALGNDGRIILSDEGDPGLSRNLGVREAVGDCVTFLDGDDLWSENWIQRAVEHHRFAMQPTIWHSEVNIVFGSVRHLWFHVDSERRGFQYEYQRVGNYWDAMSFGSRQIYVDTPFVANDVAGGYGHEDWHWNNVTFEIGIAHRPVPGTVHGKRSRSGSQMAKCAMNDVVVRPSKITAYSWARPDE